MRNFMSRIRSSLIRFMYGRYGNDELNRFLTIVAVLLIIVTYITGIVYIYLLSLIFLIFCYFRMMSRNIYKRQKERNRYLKIRNPIVNFFKLQKNKWRDRKTHRYLKCPKCKAVVRITKPPKGKTITINCPKCHMSFDHNT